MNGAVAPQRPAGGPVAARIGPNAITRLGEALLGWLGPQVREQVFGAAGLLRYLEHPPEAMVDEREVMALHHSLHAVLGPAQAGRLAAQAGRLTARYLLAHRIPRPVQWLLKGLPAPWAARVLLRSIQGHAWTFAGSGRFDAVAATWGARALGHPQAVLWIRDNPLCRSRRAGQRSCDYYAAVFETLFAELVHPEAQVHETDCESRGAAACRFELRWPSGNRG